MGTNMFDGIGTALLIMVLIIVGIVTTVNYFIFDNGSEFESKSIVTPEIKLIINDTIPNKVDTIYVYKFKD